MQKGAAKAGGALFLTFSCGPSVVIPGRPSARLNHDLELNTGRRLLRFSILKGTPTAPQAFPAPPVSSTRCGTRTVLLRRMGELKNDFGSYDEAFMPVFVSVQGDVL